MIYVYDILVNLSEEMFDFYDWEEGDSLSHVRRTPMYKIKESDFYDLISKDIKISEDILNTIKDKTQVFSSRNIDIISYASIFTDGNNACMVTFDSNGNSVFKSKFLVNEEIEILDIAKSMKYSDFKYDIIKNNVKRNKMLRNEKKILNNILSELEKVKNEKEKIDYLFYEWFEVTEGKNKYEKLIEDLRSKFTLKHVQFLDILYLLNKAKVNK